ncbi:MAG: hypothetical protein E7253_11690 [Lachnospiraceae bacterium]|nr:hypothetical protein [Lachnospiraceae bacterium]
MELNIQLKQAGNRQNKITTAKLLLHKTPSTIEELITLTVQATWQSHKEKAKLNESFEHGILNSVILYPQEELEQQAASGKIDFGFLKSAKTVSKEHAILTALEAFRDGIVALFIDGEQYEDLQTPLALSGDETITFIKLTMLSGRLW